ncbi:MAG: hypothetical protein QOI83_2880 [Streptomycetaceae bacterium]|nr:hypothetical protein [Streptomycetaceae bacterium]
MTDQPLAPAVAADEPPAAPTLAPEPAEPTEPAQPAAPAPKAKRRVLRAALRWMSAVLVFAALGGATAYAVTQPDRTTIPGLKTPDDGRWTYPALTLPKLPEGAVRALDAKNPDGRHYADLRALLLPAPAGAKTDPAFPGPKGWLPAGTFVKLFQKDASQQLAQQLRQDGLRHIAARAWTAQDGTRTEIYLLQYISKAYAARSQLDLSSTVLDEAPMSYPDPHFTGGGDVPDGITPYVYDQQKSRGTDRVRYAYLVAGDTVGVVVLSHRGSVPAVPTHQTVLLQAQLLG